MTRIPESALTRQLVMDSLRAKEQVNKYSQEVSTGYKVREPGDTTQAATISQMQDMLTNISEQRKRASQVQGYLAHQDEALSSVNEVLVRANEIATQAANETNGPEERQQLVAELYEIREQVVSLANTQYLGRYVFSGQADDAPAYSLDGANPFTVPADTSDRASFNYVYNTNGGSDQARSVNLTESVNIDLVKPGNDIFDRAIRGLTQLTRSLDGYQTVWTTTDPPVPDGANSDSYTFPDEYEQQTQDIQDALTLIDQARSEDISPARTDIGGRMRRVQTAENLLELNERSATDILSNLQEADLIESASSLTEAQTTLNAALTVTTQLLRQSILDYL